MKYKYEELKQKSVSRRQRWFSPENSAKRRDLEYQESIAFPVIDYANTAKIWTSISDLSNNNTNLLYVKSASISKHNFQNIYSYQTEEEIKLKNFEQSREINTRLNIRISDRCKDLIECTKFPAWSNIKLKRKLRMLSASPKRNIKMFLDYSIFDILLNVLKYTLFFIIIKFL